MEVFRPENNRVHVSRSCGDLPGLLIEWIDNFKKAAFDPVHEPGHIKCRNIGTPGSRDDDLRVQGSKVQGLKIKGIRHQALGKEKVDFNDFT